MLVGLSPGVSYFDPLNSKIKIYILLPRFQSKCQNRSAIMCPKNTVLMYHSKFPKKSVMEDTEAVTVDRVVDMEVDTEADMGDVEAVEVSEVSEVDLEEDLEESKFMTSTKFSILKIQIIIITSQFLGIILSHNLMQRRKSIYN